MKLISKLLDQKAIEDAGYDKGLKDGIKKIAKNLLQLNMSIEQIEKATGLTKEEIEKLK